MRALRAPHAVPEPKVELRAGPLPPYRHFGDEPAIEPGSVLGSIVTGPAPVADPLLAVRRLLTGSAFALYLSAWTASWTSGSFPVHALPLDVLLTAVILLGAWRLRARVALAPLAVTWAHLVMQAHVVPAPTSLLGWGAASIGLGFAVLIGSLATSWWLGTSRVAGPPKMGKMR